MAARTLLLVSALAITGCRHAGPNPAAVAAPEETAAETRGVRGAQEEEPRQATEPTEKTRGVRGLTEPPPQ